MLRTLVLLMAVSSALVYAQTQMAADGRGVTVNLNGSALMHRTPVNYPADALAKGVEGTVVVQVHLDSQGDVTDDAVLSGPDELRKSVQLALLNWHFDAREGPPTGSLTRVVNISFAKPAGAAQLKKALTDAFAADGPTLIEVHQSSSWLD